MGLDVGIVKIKYVETLRGPVRGFLAELAVNLDWDDEVWGGGWEGNVFLQILRDDLESKVQVYCSEKNLSQGDAATLASWVEGLPWDGQGDIMLTMNR